MTDRINKATGMKKHFSIAFPVLPGAPIILMDYYYDKSKEISLNQAGQFIIGAHLRKDAVIYDEEVTKESEGMIQVISIIDSKEVLAKRAQWIIENAQTPVGQAFEDVIGKSLPIKPFQPLQIGDTGENES